MSPRTTAGVFLFVALAMIPAARADEAAERLKALKARLRAIEEIEKRLGPERARMLSSGAQNVLQLAKRLDRLQPGEEVAEFQGTVERPAAAPPAELGMAGPAVRRVSDPATDFILSQQSGFTQSETSTAWCGDNVVVGFNDSGSFWETGGMSSNGVAHSTDRGSSFVDLGFLPPGLGVGNQLLGDPVVACSSEQDFAYASMFFYDDAVGSVQTAISVSRSSDGGLTFADPVPAVAKPVFEEFGSHLLDKPWFAVSPSDPQRMYVTYTDFDTSGTSAGCGFQERVALEIVRSTDGGATWSAPLVLDEVCGPFSAVQYSQVVVGHQGYVFVAWEHLDDLVTRDMRVARSTDDGATFGPARVVSGVTCVGNCYALKGGFRSGLESPSLAVDRSPGPTRGRLYLAWHDGRRVRVGDLESPTGFYGFADILLSRSDDGGQTWSPPTQANKRDAGSDQFQPGIAVDAAGRLGACYYDRRLDPANFLVGRSCAVSADGGETWRERRVVPRAWPPFHDTDTAMHPDYMGDYDSLTVDSAPSSQRRGFLGAFSREDARGNPDVFANRLRP